MNVPRTYPHRLNRDGSYDSICPTCFMTASHAPIEAELSEQDKAHVCGCSMLTKYGYYSVAQPMQPCLAPSVVSI